MKRAEPRDQQYRPRHLQRRWAAAAGLLAVILVAGLAGCAVPQPGGHGSQSRLVEPATGTGYWLYTPAAGQEADPANPGGRARPIVVTLHGLRPYDNAVWQSKEWQAEADRWGFIVIAPELQTCDSLTMQFPLVDPQLPYVQHDEKAILAIIDEVARTTNADPTRVLVTSFSSGGYLAHYLMNRHPDRFSCLAARQSNFSASLMDPARAPASSDHPILIISTQNDFSVCQKESKAALAWYADQGYTHVSWVQLKALGHERTPDVAAAFFGLTAGIEPPSTDGQHVARREALDGDPTGVALVNDVMRGGSIGAKKSGFELVPVHSVAAAVLKRD